MSNSTDPRALKSRKALHDAMLTLLDKKPLSAITIKELSAEAGIGYTTFFRHHATKEALLDEIAEEQITELINRSIPLLYTADLRAASKAIFTYVDQHRMMWSTLLTGGASGTVRDEFLKKARVAAALLPNSDKTIPIDCGIVLIVSGTIELIDWWLRSTKPLAVERIAEIFDLAVVSPIMQANGFDTKSIAGYQNK